LDSKGESEETREGKGQGMAREGTGRKEKRGRGKGLEGTVGDRKVREGLGPLGVKSWHRHCPDVSLCRALCA